LTSLNLRQPEYFLAVADERHFGHAAARLLVSPASVSEAVAALERRLGTRLFDCCAAAPASAPPFSLGRPARRTPGHGSAGHQIDRAHPLWGPPSGASAVTRSQQLAIAANTARWSATHGRGDWLGQRLSPDRRGR
jgi:hypothetical protein